MSEPNQLFQAFPTIDKATWLQKIEADLKGRSLGELDWQLEDHIRLSAANTKEDVATITTPMVGQRQDNSWEIGEYVRVTEMGAGNAQALEGLNGGINAPLFQLPHLPTVDELSTLLADIEPRFISVHFAPHHPGKDPAELFRNLIYYARQEGYALADIDGSVDFDPLLDWVEPPMQPLARILDFAQAYTPRFKVLQINGRSLHTGPQYSSRELALIVAKGLEYIVQLQALGVPPTTINSHMQFSLATSTNYFVEIAKIRALKILWANVLAMYGLEQVSLPPVIAHLSAESQTTERESNMIRAATQAMSAIIGGANRLYIKPADQSTQAESTAFTRRIARNVQHLLQLESGLDQVIDPAAGSYFIENLTQQLCEQAWATLKEIETVGGYAKYK